MQNLQFVFKKTMKRFNKCNCLVERKCNLKPFVSANEHINNEEYYFATHLLFLCIFANLERNWTELKWIKI